MITAKELKKLMPVDVNAEIGKIQSDLIGRAKKGCNCMALDYGIWIKNYDDPDKNRAREILEGLGFVVEFHNTIQQNTTVIRW